MGVRCCRKSMLEVESIILYDTSKATHRILTVYECKNPQCKSKKAIITYFDKIKSKFIKETVKKNVLEETIREYRKSPFLSDINKKIKQGSKSNMYWTYSRNGNIYDFNETLLKSLKTINS